MTEKEALETLREEMPEYEFEVQGTDKFEVSSILEVGEPEGVQTHTLTLDVLDALDREGVSKSQARESLVAFVRKSIEQ